MKQVQKHGRVEVVVAATVPEVWRVAGDPTRTGEWSHECRAVRWLGGADRPSPGARFRGSNVGGWVRWSRTCEIVTVTAPREIAWRTVPTLLFPDSTEWRIELEPAERGTTIRQSFTVLRAPRVLDRIYALLIPSHQDRDARLAQDLERIGVAARSGVSA